MGDKRIGPNKSSSSVPKYSGLGGAKAGKLNIQGSPLRKGRMTKNSPKAPKRKGKGKYAKLLRQRALGKRSSATIASSFRIFGKWDESSGTLITPQLGPIARDINALVEKIRG